MTGGSAWLVREGMASCPVPEEAVTTASETAAETASNRRLEKCDFIAKESGEA